jgi:hypothetical protein
MTRYRLLCHEGTKLQLFPVLAVIEIEAPSSLKAIFGVGVHFLI